MTFRCDRNKNNVACLLNDATSSSWFKYNLNSSYKIDEGQWNTFIN